MHGNANWYMHDNCCIIISTIECDTHPVTCCVSCGMVKCIFKVLPIERKIFICNTYAEYTVSLNAPKKLEVGTLRPFCKIK